MDVSNKAQLIVFVRYFANNDMKTEFLFCKALETTCKGADIFKEIDSYFAAHDIPWKNLCFCTTDGAKSMMELKLDYEAKSKP